MNWGNSLYLVTAQRMPRDIFWSSGYRWGGNLNHTPGTRKMHHDRVSVTHQIEVGGNNKLN